MNGSFFSRQWFCDLSLGYKGALYLAGGMMKFDSIQVSQAHQAFCRIDQA